MKQFLRNNYAAAFIAGLDYDNANLSGGVAIWDTPKQVMCAFNPIIFTRTHFLYRTATYSPTQSPQPNYILVNSGTATLQFAAGSAFQLVFDTAAGGDPVAVSVPQGSTSVSVSSATSGGRTLVGVRATSSDPTTDYLALGAYIYVRQGYDYQDDNFLCKGSNGHTLYRDLVTVQTVTFDVFRSGTVKRTLSAESYKGRVRFDVSSLVRKWLSSSLADIPASKLLVSDKALSVRFFIEGIGGINTSYTYLAVNAVAQTGEYADRTSFVGKVLTELPSLYSYEGYELDYSVLAGSTDVTLAARLQGETAPVAPSMAVSRVRVQDSSHYLAEEVEVEEEEVSSPIRDEQSALITMLPKFDIPVFARCIPPRPFYVRWVNRLGGVDYWMFGRTQKRSPQVKSASTFAPYVEDTGASRTNAVPYALTTDNTVTAGAGDLSPAEYAVLEALPFSPIIEHYDEALGKWIRLSVAKFSGDDRTNAARKEIEITFTLPTINTQF